MKRPKLKRDWIGRRVRLLEPVTNGAGTTFAAGLVMLVERNYGGVHLVYSEACERCRLRHTTRITKVAISKVELLPED